ncbi:hypothetical protein MMC13_002311 [Lambiella insularis]|nr:hypothetical protein [Lambiella insularis]
MASTQGLSPNITFYTNHVCPWAHRAHITIKELGLPYEEVIIDLDRPREDWYLKINPRGLVPAIKFSNGVLKDEVITESAVVSHFLADAFPSHLLPASHESPTAPLIRARMNFFVDTWFSKVNHIMFEGFRCENEKQKEEKATQLVETIKSEIEPLLKGCGPFFGGSKKMTLAECLIAPFVLRVHAYSKAGLLHKSADEGLEKLPNYSKWQKAMTSQESVLYTWNEEKVVAKTEKRMEKMRAEKTKPHHGHSHSHSTAH